MSSRTFFLNCFPESLESVGLVPASSVLSPSPTSESRPKGLPGLRLLFMEAALLAAPPSSGVTPPRRPFMSRMVLLFVLSDCPPHEEVENTLLPPPHGKISCRCSRVPEIFLTTSKTSLSNFSC